MERKTPLYDRHLAAKGKLVPFAGYLLPVQYSGGVIAEHMAVRQKAGLFDVSHMGEVVITGPDALDNINNLYTNDFTGMIDGAVRYSPICNEQGGVVDDLIVCRLAADSYLMVVNAANREKDVAWMRAHLAGDVILRDISEQVAQLAVQGPATQQLIETICDPAQLPVKYYSFTKTMQVAGIDCLVSRTGYTGEDGLELYCAPDDAPALWDAVLQAGEPFGLIPCGLGARDTLRLEASMPLYGHEMDDTISPLEAGLDFAVKLKKPDFIGKAALEGNNPPKRRRVGLKILGRGIVREHCDVYADGALVGHTTSGTYCPYLGRPAAMALLAATFTAPGTTLEVDVRGRRIEAEVAAIPFYKRAK